MGRSAEKRSSPRRAPPAPVRLVRQPPHARLGAAGLRACRQVLERAHLRGALAHPERRRADGTAATTGLSALAARGGVLKWPKLGANRKKAHVSSASAASAALCPGPRIPSKGP
eukprot:gnl/Chilomastix_cuspidata/6932.p3 GENE.gnl/Chilomastix_cuspidata/6932~~gnl/Chilomastix_cuspidata/6932.p3  ORF type:complete len:114 (+),score=2.73 gnl/Chilomastix_cuspidata/6932:315-656(+)